MLGKLWISWQKSRHYKIKDRPQLWQCIFDRSSGKCKSMLCNNWFYNFCSKWSRIFYKLCFIDKHIVISYVFEKICIFPYKRICCYPHIIIIPVLTQKSFSLLWVAAYYPCPYMRSELFKLLLPVVWQRCRAYDKRFTSGFRTYIYYGL